MGHFARVDLPEELMWYVRRDQHAIISEHLVLFLLPIIYNFLFFFLSYIGNYSFKAFLKLHKMHTVVKYSV